MTIARSFPSSGDQLQWLYRWLRRNGVAMTLRHGDDGYGRIGWICTFRDTRGARITSTWTGRTVSAAIRRSIEAWERGGK